MYFHWALHICLGLFLALQNKSARICLIVFECTRIPRFGKWNNVKKRPCCHIEAGESCGFIPDRLKTWPKPLHSYPFIKPSRNEAFRHFIVNFIKWLPWNRWPVTKTFVSVFVIYSHVLWPYKVLLPSTGSEIRYQTCTSQKVNNLLSYLRIRFS